MLSVRLLFLAASPRSLPNLELDREAREVTARLRASDGRDAFEVQTCWAVRPDDLLQYLNQYRPHIVHFSGHGMASDGIALEDEQRRPFTVTGDTLSHLFDAISDNVRLVVLNACYSAPQAQAIVNSIDCAIGTPSQIGDDAAIRFAAAFYSALGFGRSVAEAVQQGVVAGEFARAEITPALVTRTGVDANRLYFVGERATLDRPLDVWRDRLSLPFYKQRGGK